MVGRDGERERDRETEWEGEGKVKYLLFFGKGG